MNVGEAILKRRSIREFLPKPIPQEDLIKILEAARWAPTAVNRQKTRFIVVTEENLLKEIANNSKIVFFRQRHAAQCSAMVVVCLDSSSWIEEVGAAIQNILLMAAELDIGTCWIGAFNRNVVRKLLNIPHSYKIFALILLGYYGDNPDPPPRLDLGKIAYLNKWRNPLTKSKGTILPKSGALSFITKRLIDTDSDMKKSPLYESEE
ncbi:MAG: nitroreductase family protein [Candidatus Helarchaeota archaeon]|nr:nitroreductase family protein [Candidatus Helarchaeota archaeon]